MQSTQLALLGNGGEVFPASHGSKNAHSHFRKCRASLGSLPISQACQEVRIKSAGNGHSARRIHMPDLAAVDPEVSGAEGAVRGAKHLGARPGDVR